MRITGELELTCSISLPRVSLQVLREEFPWIRSIERDVSSEAPGKVVLASILPDDIRVGVSASDYQQQISGASLTGYQHLLLFLRKHRLYGGHIYIDFPGIVVLGSCDIRYIPYSWRMPDQQWQGGWRPINDAINPHHRVAIVVDSPEVESV